jgi:hypothetical protein
MAFEYKIVTSSASDEDDATLLNELGAEGWELVSVLVGESYEEDDEGEEYPETVYTFYFKRQKAA